MNLNLHRNARTTPAIRRELQTSTKSDRELAREYQLNRGTVRKWRGRGGKCASGCPVIPNGSDCLYVIKISKKATYGFQ